MAPGIVAANERKTIGKRQQSVPQKEAKKNTETTVASHSIKRSTRTPTHPTCACVCELFYMCLLPLEGASGGSLHLHCIPLGARCPRLHIAENTKNTKNGPSVARKLQKQEKQEKTSKSSPF